MTASAVFVASVGTLFVAPPLDRFGGGVVVETWGAVLAVLPFMITIWWLDRLHRGQGAVADTAAGTEHRAVVRPWPVTAGVILLVSAAVWSHAGLVERDADPLAWARYVGCYEVRLGPSVPPAMSGYSISAIVPARLVLDSMRGARLIDWSVEIPAQIRQQRERGRLLVRPGWRGAAYWTPIEDDRVKLTWTTGLYGVTMPLRRQGEELRGVAIYFTDFIGLWPEPRVRVRLVRAACSLVGPDSARATSRPPP